MKARANGTYPVTPKEERSHAKSALLQNPEDRLFTLKEAAELSAVTVLRIKSAVWHRELRAVKLRP
jgi:hypothetical protein